MKNNKKLFPYKGTKCKGIKFDNEKPQYDLIPPEAIEALAIVLTHGANKYEARNWEKGLSYSRIFAALMRHMWAWWWRKDIDKDSGFNHLQLALCNIVFLVTYTQRGMNKFDDRPKSKNRR